MSVDLLPLQIPSVSPLMLRNEHRVPYRVKHNNWLSYKFNGGNLFEGIGSTPSKGVSGNLVVNAE